MQADSENRQPKDQGGLVYIVFILLGLGSLSAWNSFLTAVDFFTQYLGDRFQFYIGIFYNIGSLPTLLVMVFYGERMKRSLTLYISFFALVAILIISPFAAELGANAGSRELAFWLSQFLVLLTGIASGVVNSNVFAMSAAFPPKYTGGVMFGQGVVAIVVAVIRIITKVLLPGSSGLVISTVIYFVVAGLINLLCIVGVWWLPRNKFASFFLNAKHPAVGKTAEDVEQADPLLSANSSLPPTSSSPAPAGADQQPPIDDDALLVRLRQRRAGTCAACFHPRDTPRTRWLFACILFASAVALNFVSTLGIYPGVTCAVPAQNAWLATEGWMAVLLITDYALFDFVGRYLPALFLLYRADWMTVLVSAARLGFIPLTILLVKPRLIVGDAAAFIIVGLMALTNGYHSTVCMMRGSEVVDTSDKAKSGAMMSFSLNVGIFTGSLLALAFEQVIS